MIPNNLEVIKSIELNENQLIAAQLMVSGMTGREIANELNVTPETISRWRQMPTFRAYLDKLLENFSDIAGQRMLTLSFRALAAIEQIFDEPNASTKDKFVAGMKILELCNIQEIVIRNIKVRQKISDETVSKIISKLNDEQLQEIIDGKKLFEDFIN